MPATPNPSPSGTEPQGTDGTRTSATAPVGATIKDTALAPIANAVTGIPDILSGAFGKLGFGADVAGLLILSIVVGVVGVVIVLRAPIARTVPKVVGAAKTVSTVAAVVA